MAPLYVFSIFIDHYGHHFFSLDEFSLDIFSLVVTEAHQKSLVVEVFDEV
jgi:hypothetical protein